MLTYILPEIGNLLEFIALLPMVGVAGTIALVGAATAAYGAHQNKKAAEEAAKGGKVQPWGQTGEYMDQLLGDAMEAWNAGQFQFGPDPNVYNAYLGYGGDKLGLDLSGIQPMDPNAGYGFEAYQQMLDMIQGPAWRGATQTNPGAMVGVQDPWVAGLMGGLGTYTALGGFGGGGGGISGNQAALANLGYNPTYVDLWGYNNQPGFQYNPNQVNANSIIAGAVP